MTGPNDLDRMLAAIDRVVTEATLTLGEVQAGQVVADIHSEHGWAPAEPPPAAPEPPEPDSSGEQLRWPERLVRSALDSIWRKP